MAVTLRKLVSNRAQASIDFGSGDVVHVEFYPARITGKMMADYATVDKLAEVAAVSPDRALEVMNSAAETLTTLLASWDLADEIADDGTVITPLPLDREHIAELGLSIQWSLLNGIVQAQSAQGEAKAPVAPQSAPTSGATS